MLKRVVLSLKKLFSARAFAAGSNSFSPANRDIPDLLDGSRYVYRDKLTGDHVVTGKGFSGVTYPTPIMLDSPLEPELHGLIRLGIINNFHIHFPEQGDTSAIPPFSVMYNFPRRGVGANGLPNAPHLSQVVARIMEHFPDCTVQVINSVSTQGFSSDEDHMERVFVANQMLFRWSAISVVFTPREPEMLPVLARMVMAVALEMNQLSQYPDLRVSGSVDILGFSKHEMLMVPYHGGFISVLSNNIPEELLGQFAYSEMRVIQMPVGWYPELPEIDHQALAKIPAQRYPVSYPEDLQVGVLSSPMTLEELTRLYLYDRMMLQDHLEDKTAWNSFTSSICDGLKGEMSEDLMNAAWDSLGAWFIRNGLQGKNWRDGAVMAFERSQSLVSPHQVPYDGENRQEPPYGMDYERLYSTVKAE